MNAHQRGTPKKSGSNKSAPKKLTNQREATRETRRDEELGTEIRRLRGSVKETQSTFADRFGVSLQRLSAWENGEKPPVEKILQIALFALQSEKLPESTKLWFWKRAGIEPQRVFGPLWSAHLAEREKAANEGAVLIPYKGEPSKPLLAVPSTRILHPPKTTYLQVPDGVRGVLCSGGDLLVIDGSEIEPRSLFGCLVAASFSAEALNLRQIIPGSVQPGRVVSHKELEFLEKLSPRSNAPELSEDEFMKKYGPVPGVRIGWLGLQCASYPDSVIFEDKSATLLPGDLWRLVLQPAFVAGLGAASLDRLPIHLSLWRTEVFPLSGALHSYVREGAQINGRVIGWFSGQQTLHPKLADLQESK